MVQDAGPARLGEELGAEADQPARGHAVLHPHPAGAVVDHLLERALAQREHLRDDADVVLGHVDREALDRLAALAVDLADQHLRLADRQLEALAAHELDEDRELQLAAAVDLPRVRPLGVLHAQRDVADQLLLEARLHLAGGDLVAVAAGERRGVDADRDRQRRLVDVDDGQRPRVLGVGERLADRDLGDAGDGDDLARPGLLGGDAVELLGDVELGDLTRAAIDPSARHHATGLALADRPVAHAAQREAADVRRGVEVRDVRLERRVGVVARRRDVLDQQVEQRLEVLARRRLRSATPGPALAFV